MVGRRLIVIIASGGLLAASSTVIAQRWGRETEPRNGACFYEDADFGGNYFCLRSGESLDSIPSGMNDRISSIRIFGDADVSVFKNPSYEGNSARFDYDVGNLRGGSWNDQISSIQVRRTYSGYRGQSRDDGYGRYGQSRDDGYGRYGRSTDRTDRVIERAYEDLLGREPDAEGLRTYRSRILDDGWSEAQVRESIRRSNEFKERTSGTYGGQFNTTRQRAEDVVRRAYLNVFNREPDPNSRGYVERVLRDNWTQQDIERELRQSPEYRQRR
jgi:hypothetical protein